MKINDKLCEECAVFGISTLADEAAGVTYNALLSMQHRGQEGSGIAVIYDNKIICHKDKGLATEVFSGQVLEKLPKSRVAIGHNRYSTTGNNTVTNVQPIITEYLTGRIATAHNGNIINAKELKNRLRSLGLHFNSTSDSEVISSLIAYHAMKSESTLEGVKKAVSELKGAFSLVVLTSTGKIIAARDTDGFRPLCIGKSSNGVAIASESCALDSSGFEFTRNVRPGEVVVIERGEIVHEDIVLTNKNPNNGICIFEYVYFARPDSTLDNLSVYEARYNMGRILAREHPVDADVVCGVPDSGIEAALGYSFESGLPLVSGFVKNRYIGRSFIYPTQSERESAVKLKLNPLRFNIEGKRVVLIDDSIVRGTTSEKIVRALKNVGAKEIHMRVSSPPFRFACHYGTDIDSEENLIANKISIDAIRDKIQADSLGYISIEGLKEACNNCNLPFCTKCFTGYDKFDITQKSIFE